MYQWKLQAMKCSAVANQPLDCSMLYRVRYQRKRIEYKGDGRNPVQPEMEVGIMTVRDGKSSVLDNTPIRSVNKEEHGSTPKNVLLTMLGVLVVMLVVAYMAFHPHNNQ